MEPQAQGHDALIGQTIGNYLVTHKLGEGGMGAVYLAEHPHIGKKVALKVLHAEFASNQDVVARFFNEARAVNDIQHPNIVDIVDYGVLQGGPTGERMVYFIMEYLGGRTLARLIREESPLSPERALTIALQVADALSASHRCGIIHRDLKPDNIMLQQRGREQDFVKLLDFGIAKLSGGAEGSRRTRTGIVMGTPAYMSPEQCEGRGQIDHRTDIYALGIVLYEMLAGRVPFVGEGYGEILVQHLTQPPVPPSTFRGVSPHVEAVVMKALEKRPAHRFPTMDEFMRAMSDPVGYVESMGGIIGFTQREIQPSNQPVPPISRLTPSPFAGIQLTPSPGTLSPPSGYGAASKPTTLGGSAGQVSSGTGRRIGIIAAITLLLVGAGTAVYLATQGTGGGSTAGTTPGTGSAIDDGTGSGTGSAPAIATADAASAAPTITADAAGSTTAADKGSGAGTGSGTGSAGTGDSTPPVASTVKVKVVSRPAGATVFLDGKRLGATPDVFEVARKDKGKSKLELKLSGYASESEDVRLDRAIDRSFVLRKRGGSGKGGTGKGSGNSNNGGGDNLIRPDDL